MGMIICKECGKEISDKASSCPNCGCPLELDSQRLPSIYDIHRSNDLLLLELSNKYNKNKINMVKELRERKGLGLKEATKVIETYLKSGENLLNITNEEKQKKRNSDSIKSFLSFICVLFLLVIIFGKNKQDKVDIQLSNEVQPNITVNNKEEIKNNVVNKGGSFEANGLKVTLNDSNIDFTDYNDEYGLYKPKDGFKYISTSFTFENTGNSDRYVSIYDFDCYADGALCEQTFNFGGDFINANLSSGRNVSFDTFYVVPIECDSIELEYTSDIWTDKKVIIKIK